MTGNERIDSMNFMQLQYLNGPKNINEAKHNCQLGYCSMHLLEKRERKL